MKTYLTGLFFALAIFLCNTSCAQKNKGFNDQEKGFLINTWYESPKESLGDTVVFRLSKYILSAGDNPAFSFSKIVFTNVTDFSIEYWRWCKAAPVAYNGNWNFNVGTTITLDFGLQKCKNDFVVLCVKTDLLKVLIKE